MSHARTARLAHADLDPAPEMSRDAAACVDHLDVTRPAPSLEYAAWRTPKREIEVSEAAAHLAARLHLR